MASLSSMYINKFGSMNSLMTASSTRPHWRFYSARSNLQPPDVHQLAAKARISLTLKQVEEFGPKIGQVIDWFGQLQDVDLENVEPTIRVEIDNPSNLRPDAPIIFEDREAMLAAVPVIEEPYIKVPKILKDNVE